MSRFAQKILQLQNLAIDIVDVGELTPMSFGHVKSTVCDDDLYVPDVADSWANPGPLVVRGRVSATDGCVAVNLSLGTARSQAGRCPIAFHPSTRDGARDEARLAHGRPVRGRQCLVAGLLGNDSSISNTEHSTGLLLRRTEV
jgi:hypothetical protein